MRNEKIVFLDPNKPIKFLKNTYLFEPCWCDVHVHQEIEFIYVNDGYIKCTVDGEKFIAKKGDIVFFNSFVPHETDDHSNNFLFNFNIPAFSVGQIKYLRNFINQSHVKHHLFTKDDECYEELKQELVQIVSIFEFSDVYYNYYIIAHIFMITALLHRIGFMGDFYDWVNYSGVSKIMPAISYIEKNYWKNIKIEELSDLVGLSVSRFCHLFKKVTNSTAINYLNFVRVCEAEKLFASGMNISEICYEVGFSSQSYFNSVFKKYKNCTPSDYQKRLIISSTDDLLK